MTPAEMKELYEKLYHTMATSKDVAKMTMFGAAMSAMFTEVARTNPTLAQTTLDRLAGLEYNNYVTPVEAAGVAARFVNDDAKLTGKAEHARGPHWTMDAVKSFLTSRNIPVEEKPFYNWPALWLTMNMEYSDYADTLVEILGTKESEKIATASYKMAVSKLKDLDRPHFIREYFDLDS